MGRETTAGGDKLDRLVRDQVGLDGGDAITLNTFHLIERPDQVDETLVGRFSEIADVDACQDDLLASFCRYLAGLRHKALDGTVAAAAPGKGNGTIGAEIIATVLYLQEMTSTVVGRAGGREGPDILGRRGDNSLVMPFPQFPFQKAGQVQLLLGTQDEVDALDVNDLFRLELRVAAGDHHEGARMLVRQAANGLPAFLVGQLSHRAGVDHADIRFLAGADLPDTLFRQHLADGRCLGEVQFAA